MNSLENDGLNQWQPCPAGTLDKMVADLRGARRQQLARRVALAAAPLLLIGAALLLPFLVPEAHQGQGAFYAGLWCSDCESLFGDYVAGSLPVKQKEQLEAHLVACPKCSEKLERMQRSQAECPSARAVAQSLGRHSSRSDHSDAMAVLARLSAPFRAPAD